jgi:hypothetical protein
VYRKYWGEKGKNSWQLYTKRSAYFTDLMWKLYCSAISSIPEKKNVKCRKKSYAFPLWGQTAATMSLQQDSISRDIIFSFIKSVMRCRPAVWSLLILRIYFHIYISNKTFAPFILHWVVLCREDRLSFYRDFCWSMAPVSRAKPRLFRCVAFYLGRN